MLDECIDSVHYPALLDCQPAKIVVQVENRFFGFLDLESPVYHRCISLNYPLVVLRTKGE